MQAKELTDRALELAQKSMAEKGELKALVIMQTKKGLVAMPYKDGSMPHEFQKLLIVGIIRACRKAGDFDGVVMVSEAWASCPSTPELAEVLRPALDPDRKEIVFAFARGSDDSKHAVTVDIIREDGKVKLGEPHTVTDEIHSWLENAFAE